MALTRSYLPKNKGVSDTYAIRLDQSMILPNVNHEFYHEKIDKEKQLFNLTLNKNDNCIQISFNPKELLKFLTELEKNK